MSKKRATEVSKLVRRMRPLLRKMPVRREVRNVTGIAHRSQFNLWFLRKKARPKTKAQPKPVRMTAPVALAAWRWLEERPELPSCRFVPTWLEVREMGQRLIRGDRHDLVGVLANRVGGGISRDQIYSYFSMNRRVPDGEFVLRFLKLLDEFWWIRRHSKLKSQFEQHPSSRGIVSALDLELELMSKREKNLARPMHILPKEPYIRSDETLSDILRRWAKS